MTPEPVRLTRLAWSPDGKLLAAGSATGVYLYDTATWQEVRFIPLEVSAQGLTDVGELRNLAFSFDGKLLGIEGRQLEVRRVADGSFAYWLNGWALAASPKEGLWATYNVMGGSPGKLQLSRTSDGQLVRELPTGRKYGILQGLTFSSDGQLIASRAREAEGFVVSRVADGSVVSKAPEDSTWWNACNDLAFQPGSSTMAVIGDDDLLALWDAKSGSLIRQLTGPSDFTQNPVVERVRFAPNGALFATSHSAAPGREGGTVQLWQANGTRIRSWPLAAEPREFAFGPGARVLAVAVGDTLHLLNPADGSVIRLIKPAWHQGIRPTPTTTPLHVGLSVPADWKEYLEVEQLDPGTHYRLRYPPQWLASRSNEYDVMFSGPSPSGFDRKSARLVTISQAGCPPTQEPGNPTTVEWMKKARPWGGLTYWGKPGERVYVAGGKWPLLIPATYAEFDTTLNIPEPRQVREIQLVAYPSSGRCVSAVLADELQDISEQDRIDFSRVLASIEYEDAQHPFPTATPTRTPTPNPAPRPVLPLQVTFSAKTSREGDRANAVITFEIKDANGNPVNGAMVKVDGLQIWPIDGRYQVYHDQYARSAPPIDVKLAVEIYWNQELIARKDYVLSWK